MKKIVILIFVLLSSVAFAEDKNNPFAEQKAHRIKEMDVKISELQAARSCYSGASDEEGMKHCHESLEKARHQHRAEQIDEKIRYLQEEKSKLNQK